MSAECRLAAVTSRWSTRSAPHPALARSALVSDTTAASGPDCPAVLGAPPPDPAVPAEPPDDPPSPDGFRDAGASLDFEGEAVVRLGSRIAFSGGVGCCAVGAGAAAEGCPAGSPAPVPVSGPAGAALCGPGGITVDGRASGPDADACYELSSGSRRRSIATPVPIARPDAVTATAMVVRRFARGCLRPLPGGRPLGGRAPRGRPLCARSSNGPRPPGGGPEGDAARRGPPATSSSREGEAPRAAASRPAGPPRPVRGGRRPAFSPGLRGVDSGGSRVRAGRSRRGPGRRAPYPFMYFWLRDCPKMIQNTT